MVINMSAILISSTTRWRVLGSSPTSVTIRHFPAIFKLHLIKSNTAYVCKCLVIGVYANLVDGSAWDREAVGSSPATPTSRPSRGVPLLHATLLCGHKLRCKCEYNTRNDVQARV